MIPHSNDEEYDLTDEEEISDEEMDGEDDSDEEDTEDEEESGLKRRKPLPLLFKMMLNPVEGWKNIRRSDISPEDFARGCFYPVCALAALSCFCKLFYEGGSASLSDCVISAVTMFVTFFFGNFLALLLIKVVMPKDCRDIAYTDFGKTFMMLNLSTFALFLTLYNALPMIGPVLVFLPIWTIYLCIRGARFFKFPEEKRSLCKTLLCIFTLGAPLAVFQLFEWLLN